MKRLIYIAMVVTALIWSGSVWAQCSNYTVNVTAGTFSYEVSWTLTNSGGTTVASGGAPQTTVYCLVNGCYTLNMSDSWGDGWNGAVFTLTNTLGQTIATATLNSGSFGTVQIEIGAGSCGPSCPYSIVVDAGTWPSEVSWTLTNSNGVAVYSGAANANVSACLPDGCYTMNMFDSYGDGWNGATFTINGPNGIVSTGNLVNGYNGTQVVSIGGADCGGGGACPYNLTVGGGTYDGEISWTLVNEMGSTVSTGFATPGTNLCLPDGCYTFNMYDSWGDGWNNAQYQFIGPGGVVIASGTLATGSFGTASISINDPDCANSTSGPVTASDCVDAVDVCTDLNFTIDPNGYGNIMEIPPLGSVANPDFGLGIYNPWGTTNWGCLRSNELNSTWMVVNIWESGWLEFSFGGLGMQVGFYDWSMWTYDENTCQDIYNNTLAPVRCNWNGVSFGGTGLAATLPPGGDASNYEPPLWVEAGEQYLICFSNWSSVTTVVPLQFGGTAVVGCGALLLPVSWLSVNAHPESLGVRLNWSTASENQNAKFEPEHSMDGQSWKKLGSVDGQGNSTSVAHYSFLHHKPSKGVNYYRIKQIDTNGDFDYSQKVAVPWFSEAEILLGPNPTEGVTYLRAPQEGLETVELFDAFGRSIPFYLNCAGDQCEIRIEHAPNGYYTLRVHYAQGATLSERILLAR